MQQAAAVGNLDADADNTQNTQPYKVAHKHLRSLHNALSTVLAVRIIKAGRDSSQEAAFIFFIAETCYELQQRMHYA
jgi:hypothetical protein